MMKITNQSKQSFEMRNQLGRRNLSPVDFKLALGRRYNRSKKQGARTDITLDQNDTKSEPINTAAKLATQHGVSEATVKRAGKLAEAVEAHPEIKEAIRSSITHKSCNKENDQTREKSTSKISRAWQNFPISRKIRDNR